MFGFMFSPKWGPSTGIGTTPSDVRMVAHDTVLPVEQRLRALELACAGLWTLLQQKHGYTNEELVAAIHDVDARDGQIDGKIGHAGQVCPHCHRKLLTQNPVKCAWCGGDLGPKTF